MLLVATIGREESMHETLKELEGGDQEVRALNRRSPSEQSDLPCQVLTRLL